MPYTLPELQSCVVGHQDMGGISVPILSQDAVDWLTIEAEADAKHLAQDLAKVWVPIT